MVTCEPAQTTFALSIVIATYNDWASLDRCLHSLGQQTAPPTFEVIVVDDGSQESAPDFIRQWLRAFPLTIIRQPHAGVSTARNLGVHSSRAPLVLFVDSDSKLQPDCVAALAATVAASPQHNCFQLHLVGDSSGPVGRAEELRLLTVQDHMLQPDGRIRYLNTAGFAIRRTRVDSATNLFDPVALRGEDTLLLVNLMQSGELPLFVPNATVQHAVPLSLLQYLRKSIRSAFLEAGTYRIIASKGVRIRVTNRERLKMLAQMWKTSRQPRIGRSAWFVLAARQALPRIVTYAHRLARSKPDATSTPSS
jgi:glycosyltransferase involved in cell wall biosynthesis